MVGTKNVANFLSFLVVPLFFNFDRKPKKLDFFANFGLKYFYDPSAGEKNDLSKKGLEF